MAKKKKPAANPARGFATTSMPSKPKPESTIEPEPKLPPKKEDFSTLAPAVQPSVQSAASQKEVPLTPEELEAQLERDELQLLVEKHAAKVRRESRRQVVKFQTDRRVLRPQAESVTVHDWLPEEILETILSFAQAESNDSNRRQGQQSLLKVMTEEDTMSKLWTLNLALCELGFKAEHIEPVLKWLCANASSIPSSASLWGFQEAMEWLALNRCEGHSFSYNEPSAKRLNAESSDTSRPGTPIYSTLPVDHEGSKVPVSRNATPSVLTPVESDHSDIVVSEVDSDMEPDELVPTYLRIKAKLFELDPDIVDAKPRKQLKSQRGKGSQLAPPKTSSAVRKLQSQLQRLESDALFDQDQADAQWPTRRNQIAQSQAAKRDRLIESMPSQDRHETVINISVDDRKSESGRKSPNVDSDAEDADLLGEMFTAIPTEPTIDASSSESPDITLRDFGKQSGLSPRRLLEEAVRAR